MINIYDFVEECKAHGMTAQEALTELQEAQKEARTAFYEDYYNSPETWAGWTQQDVIDMYRMER